ncbi:hypothetical protein VTN49DRAFT_4076 [Thermomyces lanuginosus]|uniref:uncharacterized protein n=1 Tax=Thermomyces lanuginosus TaxID=5541 RepID=UPI0037437E13
MPTCNLKIPAKHDFIPLGDIVSLFGKCKLQRGETARVRSTSPDEFQHDAVSREELCPMPRLYYARRCCRNPSSAGFWV